MIDAQVLVEKVPRIFWIVCAMYNNIHLATDNQENVKSVRSNFASILEMIIEAEEERNDKKEENDDKLMRKLFIKSGMAERVTMVSDSQKTGKTRRNFGIF